MKKIILIATLVVAYFSGNAKELSDEQKSLVIRVATHTQAQLETLGPDGAKVMQSFENTGFFGAIADYINWNPFLQENSAQIPYVALIQSPLENHIGGTGKFEHHGLMKNDGTLTGNRLLVATKWDRNGPITPNAELPTVAIDVIEHLIGQMYILEPGLFYQGIVTGNKIMCFVPKNEYQGSSATEVSGKVRELFDKMCQGLKDRDIFTNTSMSTETYMSLIMQLGKEMEIASENTEVFDRYKVTEAEAAGFYSIAPLTNWAVNGTNGSIYIGEEGFVEKNQIVERWFLQHNRLFFELAAKSATGEPLITQVIPKSIARGAFYFEGANGEIHLALKHNVPFATRFNLLTEAVQK